ncbi:MAG: Fe-S cluster assembly protein SufD [Candidatus Puniceispirillales bacterium]
MSVDLTLDDLRAAAAARFAEAGWPTPRHEAWKFTNLSRLRDRDFVSAAAAGTAYAAGLPQGRRLVFENGFLNPDLSTDLPDGVVMVALADDPAGVQLLTDDKLSGHPVADKTIAELGSGISLKVTGAVAEPLYLVFANSGDDTAAHPVIVLDLAKGAALTLLEQHNGAGKGLSMPVMACRLGDVASLDHGRIQTEDDDRTHLGQAVFQLGEKSRYHAVSVQTGAVLSRVENHLDLAGDDADVMMTTLYLARRDQVMDVTTHVNHDSPSCTSMQVVRGVLDDTARGVFQGKVKVAPDAQKTDGNQMSRALLLSRKCEADAKPELEIYADDVACSHGATVGEIDDTHLFYLMSRGITAEVARQMLIEAFLEDALAGVEGEALHNFALPPVKAWLSRMKEAQ